MGYLYPTVIVVSSNPYVEPSSRTKTYFFLLLICTDELFSNPKIKAFNPNQNFK